MTKRRTPLKPNTEYNKKGGSQVKKRWNVRKTRERDRSVSSEPAVAPVKKFIDEKNDVILPDDIPQLNSELVYVQDQLRKSSINIMNESKLRLTISPRDMAQHCHKLRKKLTTNGDDLLDTIDNALNSIPQKMFEIDRSILHQEIVKYLLIASSDLEKLTTETVLRIICDMKNWDYIMRYLPGFPTTPPSFYEYFKIDRQQYEYLPITDQLDKKEKHLQMLIEYTEKVEDFIREKEEVDEKEVAWSRDQLCEARRCNQADRTRYMNRLENIRYKLRRSEHYYLLFRAHKLANQIGVRTEKEEKDILDLFQSAPIDVHRAYYESREKINYEVNPLIDGNCYSESSNEDIHAGHPFYFRNLDRNYFQDDQ